MALDVEGYPFDHSDNHQQGVGCTCYWVDGYTPDLRLPGRGRLSGNCGPRPGTQHRQAAAVPFLRQAVRQARRITPEKLRVRLEAAHDEVET